MPVYVDDMKRRFGRMIMCHMIADSLPELHVMADKIGVNYRWFQNHRTPYYDICLAKRDLAIKQGAILIDKTKLLEIIRRNRSGNV